MRPRQWVKNALVVAAPLAAGRLLELDVALATALAFALFCVAASGVYLVNDVRDAALDRLHPTKRLRPVAAGLVPPRLALLVGAILLVAALALAVTFGTLALAAVLVTYVVTSLAYCFWLKNQPVIDLAVVSCGFLLRATAGGAAAGIALSQWFLLVASFGSLFMVAGKRYSEMRMMGTEGGTTRRSLHEYSDSYLRFVWSMSASVVVMTYSLWAFEMTGATTSGPWAQISIAPFVLGMLRYAVDIDRGAAGAPDDIILGDRVLQGFGVGWLVLIAMGLLGA
jgi:decaprenyl-phosphate phosphoribosyltransferase